MAKTKKAPKKRARGRAIDPTRDTSFLDFYGYHRSRDGLQTVIDNAVKKVKNLDDSKKNFVNAVGNFLNPVGDLLSYITGLGKSFSASYSLSAPGLTGEVVESAIPGDTFLSVSLPDFLSSIVYFFKGVFQEISQTEVYAIRSLFQLPELYLDSDSPVFPATNLTNLQNLRIYYVEFFHDRFKDRNGVKIGPPATIQGLPVAIPEITPQLAGRLVQVLAEFVGDALFQVGIFVPGTGMCGAGGAPPDSSYTCFKAGVIQAALPAVLVDGDGPDKAGLVGTLVQYAARQTEQLTRAVVGSLVMGGGLAAINNQAIAEALAALLAGLAKKVAEKVAFEILSEYITDPNVDQANKQLTIQVLEYLHCGGPVPVGFPPPFQL